jgi:hypothetical protein
MDPAEESRRRRANFATSALVGIDSRAAFLRAFHRAIA